MIRPLIIFLLVLPFGAAGQDLDLVSRHLKELTDSSLFGRGYVNNGSNWAADYLVEQYELLSLRMPEKGFQQKFSMEVNTYPHDLHVSLDGRALKPGYDFIVNPRTGSSAGSYPFAVLDSTNFQEMPALFDGDTIPVVNMQGIDSPNEASNLFEYKKIILASKPVVLLEDKLTWSVGNQVFDQAEISLLSESFEYEMDSISLSIHNEMRLVEVANVVGYIPGRRSDSTIVFTAHYDHLGMMGSALFPGASDNASGTSMLLDLAHHYSQQTPEFTTWFICFAGEEAGLAGSRYFVENPLLDLKGVKLLINLDLMGSASKGIAVVNGKKYLQIIDKLSEINTEKNLVERIKIRGQAANSDHYWFAEKGVPAIFIYTMGSITAYHDVYDTHEVVDWERYPEVFKLITEFVSAL
mgnify:CR=1 FL=1